MLKHRHVVHDDRLPINLGWYSESSVANIIYDIGDSENEMGDGLSMGLGPIFDALIDADFTGNDYLNRANLIPEVLEMELRFVTEVALRICQTATESTRNGRRATLHAL